MSVNEIQSKSIFRKARHIDSWFISTGGMNLYRGCTHNCVYCDGRSENYYVEGEFGRDIQVKTNAIELLRRELDPSRKRKPWRPGYVVVGGGVNDSYQPIEKKYKLTRQALELCREFNHPVHMLTKSTLIERDMDILAEIRENSNCLISFSFSSVDEKISKYFEPGVPSPQKRLETMHKLKNAGFNVGMFMMPVIPFITDSREKMEATVKTAKDINLDYIIFGGMTLKPGRQRDYFYDKIRAVRPEMLHDYEVIYGDDKWGQANGEYYQSLGNMFYTLAKAYQIRVRIPSTLFKYELLENDLVAVLLEQMDYMLKLKNAQSPYGYAARSIAKLEFPLSSFRENLTAITGVGKTVQHVIREILDTKTCQLYEKLISHKI